MIVNAARGIYSCSDYSHLWTQFSFNGCGNISIHSASLRAPGSAFSESGRRIILTKIRLGKFIKPYSRVSSIIFSPFSSSLDSQVRESR